MQHQKPIHLLPLFIITIALTLSPFIVTAQAAPNPTLTAEYNIGFNCPVSATFDPTQTTLWVLMNNCGSGGFTLQGFNVADGSPVKADDKNFVDALAPLKDMWIYSNTIPLAFTPDGALDVRYNDSESYDALNLRLSLTASEPPASDLTLLTNAALQDFIPGFAGYPETITYNTDHTLAVVPDTTLFHIMDLQAGKELLQIESQPTADYSTASFSQDKQHLYITTAKDPDNMQNNNSTLKVYGLPDGKLLKSYDVPSYVNYVSPDGRFVAGYVGGQYDAALLITDLETGSFSQPILVNEPPHLVTECLNSGKKLTGLDFKTSGELYVIDLIWLPDSSGFLTVNTYGGEGAQGGGGACIFNYSRLRQYKVQ